MFNEIRPLEGAYVHNSMDYQTFGGIPKMLVCIAIFSEIDRFQTKRFTGLFRTRTSLLNKTHYRIFFIFTIYKNYTLALIVGLDYQQCNALPTMRFKFSLVKKNEP